MTFRHSMPTGAVHFLAHIVDVYGTGRLPHLYLREQGKAGRMVTLADVSGIDGTLISFDCRRLGNLLRQAALPCPASIVDVCDVGRLLHGRPFGGKRGREPWNVWNLFEAKFGR